MSGDSAAAGDVLITPAELQQRLREEPRPAILDVRWKLGDPHGADHYRERHLPGAVYVDLDTELAAPASLGAGRHPLPDATRLQAAARRWGVRREQRVVVYDDNGGTAAARAWWLLRWAGVADVRILDGALAGWLNEGLATETGDAAPRPGDVTLRTGDLTVLSADQAAELPATGVLLDARAAARYRGEVEPVDPRAGHIPGAVSAPTTDALTPEGRFLDAGALRSWFATLGVTGESAVGAYCGSGVTAAHLIAALRVAGFDAALYPGSWSAWSADPDRPAALGPVP